MIFAQSIGEASVNLGTLHLEVRPMSLVSPNSTKAVSPGMLLLFT